MLIMGFWGFILGFFLPIFASRFGKIISSDPGSMLYEMFHKPRFPKSKNESHCFNQNGEKCFSFQ